MLSKNDLTQHRCYRVGYCELAYLLVYSFKLGYNAGTYGWNYDAYYIGANIVISTGYRNLVGKKIDSTLCRMYNNKAKAIFSTDMSYKQKKKEIDDLIVDFIEELTNDID